MQRYIAMILSLALAAQTWGAEAPGETAYPPADDTDQENVSVWGDAVDASHQSASTRVGATARWIDGFFGTDRAEQESNFSYLRVTPSMIWDDMDGFEPRIRVRGKLDLPGSRRQFSVIISGDENENIPGFGNPDDETDLGNNGDDDRAVGLQWVLRRSERYHSSFNATLTSGLNPRVSWRLRRSVEIGERTNGFLSARPFWHSEDGFGVQFRGQGNYTISDNQLLRLTASAETYEELDGWEYRANADYFTRVSRRAIVSWALNWSRNTDPADRNQAFTFGPTYRQNFFRPWLFGSVRPFVSWRSSATEENQRVHGILFEIDVFLGRSRKLDRAYDDALSSEKPAQSG